MSETTAINELFHFSNFKNKAHPNINKIEVDLIIVQRGTVIYTNDQFDNPISKALAVAVGMTVVRVFFYF